MTNPNAVNQKVEDKTLIALEKDIAKSISPMVFNYIFLLDPTQNYQVQLKNPLTKDQLTLIQKYNSSATTLLKENGVDIDLKMDDTFEKFKIIQKDIYTLRFIQAKKYFAKYSLVRILTQEEAELAKLMKEPSDIPVFLEIYVPDAIKLLENGSVDLDSTIELEKKTNQIAATMSSYSFRFGSQNA